MNLVSCERYQFALHVMKKITLLLDRWQIFFLGLISLFLTFNLHSKAKYNSYHHVLWADGAGYYSYLPATFIYHFDKNAVPDSLNVISGNGFNPPSEGTTIHTKYTYGVALLELPFFIIAYTNATFSGTPFSGFEPEFHWSIMVAGVFYLSLGLYFLKKYLRFYYSAFSSAFSILVLWGGTAVFYYGIHKSSYSHIYLFFLFSVILYFTEKYSRDFSKKSFYILSIAAVLSVLIRPTSIIFLAFVFFQRVSFSEIRKDTITRFLKSNWKPIAISTILIFPQLIYWYAMSGQLLHYSYTGEGFSNWKSPALLETWFSPNNGLFLYTPLMFISLIGMIIGRKERIYVSIFFLFLILSYIFSSWHDWSFGCSYSSRSFTEYMTLFILPIAFILDHHFLKKFRPILLLFCLLLIYIAFVNISTIYSYDDCFYAATWDFDTYFHLLKLW